MPWRLSPIAVVLVALLAGSVASAAEIEFEKITVEQKFRSEGAAAGDVNKDGKIDVIVGDVWYEAPDWKIHEIRTPANLRVPDDYSEAFGVHAEDFNQDGWVDVMVIPFHGKDAKWYENPQGKEGHWVERIAFPGTGNETRLYADLFRDGKRVFVMGVQDQLAWVPVPDDAAGPWRQRPISEGKVQAATLYAHGLGIGDINSDGRDDLITNAGWYEQPEDARKGTKPWKFHAVQIGNDTSDLYAVDFDADGKNDVLASSAHGRGIWSLHQKSEGDKQSFESHTLYDQIPVTHCLHYIDLDGDGKKEVLTGQRPGTHGSRDMKDISELVWFEVKAADGKPPELVPHVIDDQSGIGTQFVVEDFNGDKALDIVISNKKGVFVFLQKPSAK